MRNFLSIMNLQSRIFHFFGATIYEATAVAYISIAINILTSMVISGNALDCHSEYNVLITIVLASVLVFILSLILNRVIGDIFMKANTSKSRMKSIKDLLSATYHIYTILFYAWIILTIGTTWSIVRLLK